MIFLNRHNVATGEPQAMAVRPGAIDLILREAHEGAGAVIEVQGDRYHVVESFEVVTGLINAWAFSGYHADVNQMRHQDLLGVSYDPSEEIKHEQIILLTTPFVDERG